MKWLGFRVAESSELQSRKLKDYQLYSDKKDLLEWELLQGSVIEKIDDDELVELHTKLDEIENKLTSLSAELKSSSKGYISLFGDRFFSIKDVQKNLSNNQLLVFPAETYADNSQLYFLFLAVKWLLLVPVWRPQSFEIGYSIKIVSTVQWLHKLKQFARV